MNIGSKIYYKDVCYNSIDWAKQEIDFAPDGSIFLAAKHEYTHGRQGRVWKTYDGQVIVTILLKPEQFKECLQKNLTQRLSLLNMAFSLGILEALKCYNVSLKWPNDFVYKDKKVGGLIAEVIWETESQNQIKGIVFGFAINVNNEFFKIDDFYEKAISLSTILGEKIKEKVLLENLIENIDKFYDMWVKLDDDYIFTLWKKNQYYLGKNIKIHKEDKNFVEGIFVDLLPNGNLVIQEKNEKRIEIPFYTIMDFV